MHTPLLTLALVAMSIPAVSSPATALPAVFPAVCPSAPQSGKADTIYRRNERTGRVISLTGIVLVNSLTEVRLDRAGKTANYDATSVVRIDWGSVPPS